MEENKKSDNRGKVFFICFLITGILYLLISGFFIKAGNVSFKTFLLLINGFILLGIGFWSLKKSYSDNEGSFFILMMGFTFSLYGSNAMISSHNMQIIINFAPLIWFFGIIEMFYAVYLINKNSNTGVSHDENKDA